MKTYELTYIISPENTIEQAESKAKEFETKIQAKEGVILRAEKPLAKTLSYQIKKYGSGFFVVLEFQTEPEVMVELKDTLEKDNQILRHIFLVKNPARKIKERRQRIRPSLVAESMVKEVEKVAEKAVEIIKEKIESIVEPKELTSPADGEKKTAIKKIKSEKNKEKAEIEDIDKKLDEILSE